MKQLNGRQPLVYKVNKLEEEIIWVNERKDIVKNLLREKIDQKSKVRRPILSWEWFKVSMSLVTVGILIFVLIGNISNKMNDFQEIHSADSVYYSWHNLEIRPVLPPENIKLAGFESYPWMIKYKKNFDLKDSQKRASFKIMRPSIDVNLPLEISRGVIEYPSGLSAKNFKGPITIWDIWHKGDKWVYVSQYLAEDSEQLINKKGKKVIWNIHSNEKVIPFKDKDAFSITRDLEESEKRISMYVKNKNKQVIHFELRGNISEGELMKLAQSYLK